MSDWTDDDRREAARQGWGLIFDPDQYTLINHVVQPPQLVRCETRSNRMWFANDETYAMFRDAVLRGDLTARKAFRLLAPGTRTHLFGPLGATAILAEIERETQPLQE